MGVTRVAYEADGWGVGELWLDGDVVVWHELPTAKPCPATTLPAMAANVVARLARYFAGDEVELNDVPVDLEYETEFLTNCAQALRSVPRGETVTYGELAALAGAPGAARAAGSFCARTGSACSSPATASSAPAVSARTARTVFRTRSDCWSSKVLSEDLRNELASIAPESDCDRLAELSGLFHIAGSVHLRGRGEVALHLDLASSAVARRGFALLRAFDVDSEIRTYQQHAFDRGTRFQLHVEGDPACVRGLASRRRPRLVAPSARAAAAASPGAPLLPRRISARRLARRRLPERTSRSSPGDPNRGAGRRTVRRRRRGEGRSGAEGADSGGVMRLPTRRESTRSPTCSRPRARGTP